VTANEHAEGGKGGRFFSQEISTFLNNTYPEDHIYTTISTSNTF